MDSDKKYIAIDIGGTQLRAALFAQDGIEPLKKTSIATHSSGERPEERLLDLIASIWPESGKVGGIGVSVAGPGNPKTGVIYKAPNIAGWDNLPLGELIANRFKTKTILGNDANLAALGEWKYGAGIGHHDLIYLTVSTGIGGGVIIDDKLLVGSIGIAAELGHITVSPDGPMCGCGHRGHLEAFSSGTGIANYVESQLKQGRKSILSLTPEKPTARQISEAAQKGDALALEAFDIAGTYLGRAIADFLHIFNPTVIILGGSVTNAGDILMNPMNKALKASLLTPQYMENVEIKPAKLGDQVSLIGALALARS